MMMTMLLLFQSDGTTEEEDEKEGEQEEEEEEEQDEGSPLLPCGWERHEGELSLVALTLLWEHIYVLCQQWDLVYKI